MPGEVFAILGATGNIGFQLSNLLLADGKTVRAIGRSPAKLGALETKGAQIISGDAESPQFLSKALENTHTAFVLIPPSTQAQNLYQWEIDFADLLAASLENAKVTSVVAISSVGAHLAERTGPILGLRYMEKRFQELNHANVLFLRPAYFMENLLFGAGLIKHQRINGGDLSPDVSIPMVATRDVAAAAADAMIKGIRGKSVRELLGPADITVRQATEAIGRALGIPDLPYVQFSYEDSRSAMINMGFSASVADNYIELARGLNEQHIKSEWPRNAQSTTPTTIEQFAGTIFKAVFDKT